MGLHNLIANGGTVLVVGSVNKAWESFRQHPQIRIWSGDSGEIHREISAHGNRLPDNVKVLILSRFVSHRESEPLRLDARRKKVVMFTNKNDGEVTRLLDEIIQNDSTPEEKEKVSPKVSIPASKLSLHKPQRGELRRFVQANLNPDVMAAEEARRLFPLAKEAGLDTTVRSVEITVGWVRKNLGLKSTKKVQPKPKVEPITPPQVTEPSFGERMSPRMVEGLDLIEDTVKHLRSAITGLELLRVIFQEVHESGGAYDQLRAQLKMLLGGK